MLRSCFFCRALIPVLILSLLWGACLAGAAAGLSGFDYGDINADGRIDASDALAALQYSVSLRALTDEEQKRADVNVSNTIDSSDALLILQYSVGLITEFDAGKQNEAREGLYGMTYQYHDGKYIQTRDAIEMDGYRTFNSIDRFYAPSMHVNVDFSRINLDENNVASWRNAGYEVSTSSSFNHSSSGYETEHPEDMQTDASGSTAAAWNSLVLTPGAIQDRIDNYISKALTMNMKAMLFVEPEMFRQGLYGEGYKKLWKDTYGTDWVDPVSSPEAVFMSQRLNISTHVNAINAWADYIKTNSPSTEFGIAPHSTMAYATFNQGITDGYHAMIATGKVDFMTGQTWSNTMINPYLYEGKKITYPFLHGFLGYGSYLDAAIKYDVDFYALNDAMSDTANGQNEPYWRERNHDQLVASLMYGEINRWEFIWTNRSFMYVSPEYRAEQMNIYNAINDISGKEFTLTAGTPGITYLLSDTLTWQTNSTWCNSPYESFYGVTAPLVQDGIPVRTKAMEFVAAPEDLEGVSLLIVSYDNMKPQSEEVNVAIADWVKAGGTLLYTGGPDSYVDIESEWWNGEGKGGSPLQNLLNHLGLNATIAPYANGISYLEWKAGTPDERFDDEQIMGMSVLDGYVITGDSFDKVITNAYDDAVAIESEVGKGHVVISGLSSHLYAESVAGADLMRILTEYALRYTNFDYVTSDSLMAERGDYTAVHSLTGTTTLEGRYINIFSDTLDVVVNPTVAEGESCLFYKLGENQASVPYLGYTGGIQDTLTETADTTTLTYHGAENALVASRFIAPEGMTPVRVSVTDSQEHDIAPATTWDDSSSTLLVQTFSTPTNPVTVTVTWGSGAPVSSARYEYFTMTVNQTGEDKDYIVRNTSAANDSCRYTDGSAELVYRFDISHYEASLFALSLYSNYLIEVSPDGENWITAVDFSFESPVRATALNTAVRAVNPDDFGIHDTLYIRMRNTDASGGWGGALNKITVQYLPKS